MWEPLGGEGKEKKADKAVSCDSIPFATATREKLSIPISTFHGAWPGAFTSRNELEASGPWAVRLSELVMRKAPAAEDVKLILLSASTLPMPSGHVRTRYSGCASTSCPPGWSWTSLAPRGARRTTASTSRWRCSSTRRW